MPKTVTLYDQNGNETVFQQHFETTIRGKMYVIFTIVGEEEKGGFVFQATPTGPGTYNYEIVMDNDLVAEVFVRFKKEGENVHDDDEYEDEDDGAVYVPDRLYVPYEIDVEGGPVGLPDSLHFIGSMRFHGDQYLICVMAYDSGGLPKGTPVVLECFENNRGYNQNDYRFELVEDYNLVQQIVDAYQKVDRSELEHFERETGEYGESNDAAALPLEDENGKLWKMAQAACIDIGPQKYFLETPGFEVPGNDGTGAWIYALRRNKKGNRFLELVDDPVISRKVFSEYHRLCDAGLGLDKGSRGDDDDLF